MPTAAFVVLLTFFTGSAEDSIVDRVVPCPSFDCVTTVLAEAHQAHDRYLLRLRVWRKGDFVPTTVGAVTVYGDPALLDEQYQ